MSDSQFNTLVQMIAELSARVEVIAANQKNFATKDDLKKFATKEDLKKFVTKLDLERFETKLDLDRFATKKDLSEMASVILDAIGVPYSNLEKQVGHHEKRISKLELAHQAR